MANICEGCSTSVYRTIFLGKKWLGVDCGCTRAARMQFGTGSAFAIELDHVADEFGRKVKVENLRQLSAAEKRYGFQSVVLNADSQNFDDPPQQRRMEVADIHRWKYSDRASFERNRSRR